MNISKSYIKYKEKFIKLTYCQRLYSRLIIKGSSNIIKLYKKSIGLIEQWLEIISIIKMFFIVFILI